MSPSARPIARFFTLAACGSLISAIALAQQPTGGSDGSAAPAAAKGCLSPTSEYVTLTVDHPDGTKHVIPNIPWVNHFNVNLAMENAQAVDPTFKFATQYYCPYGRYVTALDGIPEGGDYYWALYVNGAFAQYGIDTQPLKPGDAVTWKVESISLEKANASDSHQLRLIARHRMMRLDTLAKGRTAP